MTKGAVIPAKAGNQVFVIVSEVEALTLWKLGTNDRNQKDTNNL
jgi:hypothetical protein